MGDPAGTSCAITFPLPFTATFTLLFSSKYKASRSDILRTSGIIFLGTSTDFTTSFCGLAYTTLQLPLACESVYFTLSVFNTLCTSLAYPVYRVCQRCTQCIEHTQRKIYRFASQRQLECSICQPAKRCSKIGRGA